MGSVKKVYRFGEFEVDEPKHVIRHRGEPLKLTGKRWDLLLHLLSRHGQYQSRSELLNAVWGERREEQIVKVTINHLRKALSAVCPQVSTDWPIVAVDRGYRFQAPVTASQGGAPPGPALHGGGPVSRHVETWAGPDRETFDFSSEAHRHPVFYGRADVLAHIAGLLDGPAGSALWVLVTGSPGAGKSAILWRFLQQGREQGRPMPHHILRHGVGDWARPDAVLRCLSSQVEQLYPDFRDPAAAASPTRLLDLLARVSQAGLVHAGRRLTLVVDGLDEAEDGQGDYLGEFLPPVLPAGVNCLVASRPIHPALNWFARGSKRVSRIDLDASEWRASNRDACTRYWQHKAADFSPPLSDEYIRRAVDRSRGNLLHVVKVHGWLAIDPARPLAGDIPDGLKYLIQDAWSRLAKLPEDEGKLVVHGLGLLCTAREALSTCQLRCLTGWTPMQVERFLARVRPFLLAQPSGQVGQPAELAEQTELAYRPFHESFREFIGSRLGHGDMVPHHRRLSEVLGWSEALPATGFHRDYALRHAVHHLLAIPDPLAARRLCTDVGFLRAKVRQLGVTALERDLSATLAALGQGAEGQAFGGLTKAVRLESSWLADDPGQLDGILYNRLLSSGVSPADIHALLPGLRPGLRLRHPVALGGDELRTLRGHTEWVHDCRFSPDGRSIVSAGADFTVRLWDSQSGRPLRTLTGHEEAVDACAFSPSGDTIVSSSIDGSLRLWDARSGQVRRSVRCKPPWSRRAEQRAGWKYAPIYDADVSFEGQRIVAATFDGSVSVWSTQTGELLCRTTEHEYAVNCTRFSPDGTRVASGSYDHTVTVWDAQSGVALLKLCGHSAPVLACGFSPDGDRIVSASLDHLLKVWDAHTGAELLTLRGHTGGVLACGFGPDGQQVVSGSQDATVRLWDARTGAQRAVMRGHSNWVQACAVSPDGRHIVSGSYDKTLKVWAAEPRAEVHSLAGHDGPVDGCCISPDGARVVSASLDGTMRVWDAVSGAVLASLAGHSEGVVDCQLSADGHTLLSASRDGTLGYWNPSQEQPMLAQVSHAGWVQCCAYSPDGTRVVSGANDGTLIVWDARTRRACKTLRGHDGPIQDCAYSPDGHLILSASRDGTLRVWNAESGTELTTLVGHVDAVHGCTFSANGKQALSASEDQSLGVWDLASGELLRVLKGHTNTVYSCAYSSDGRRIISASRDNTLKVWDASSGECESSVYGSSSFLCLAVHPGLVVAGDAAGNLWMLEPP